MYPVVNSYQSARDIYYPLRVVMFIGLLSMGYVLSKPIKQNKDDLLADTRVIDVPSPLAWQKTSSEKAIKKYIDAQEKQWQRWNEAMFERKD